MSEVGCIVVWLALILGCLGGLVLTVDMAVMEKKFWVTSGFGLKVMIVGSVGVSGTCTLQISCGTQYKIL